MHANALIPRRLTLRNPVNPLRNVISCDFLGFWTEILSGSHPSACRDSSKTLPSTLFSDGPVMKIQEEWL